VIRRTLTALAAAAGAELCCVAGSVFRIVRLIARVDGESVWTALNSRRNLTLTTWQAGLAVRDRLIFAAVPVAAAAAVLAAPYLRPRLRRLLEPFLTWPASRIRAALAARTARRG
jgi:hypothetical protein